MHANASREAKMGGNLPFALSGARSREEIEHDWTLRHRARVKRVVRRIAREHECTVEDLYATSTHPSITRARRRAYAVLRWSTGLSFSELGRIFNRDHTTILAGVRKYEAELNAAEVA